MKQFFYVGMIWIWVAWGCDPCDDCGEPLRYDPVVRMVFINQDSAHSLSDSIALNTEQIAYQDSVRRVYQDSVAVLTDSLVTVDSLVEAGDNDFISVQEAFNSNIDTLKVMSDTLQSWSAQLTSVNRDLNSVVTTINNGLLSVQSVRLLENNAEVVFEDSMRQFGLPLLLAESRTSFQISIAGEQYSIAYTYDTYETVDAARRVQVKARNLDTVAHSFDSLVINCRTEECISDETTVTAYF